MIAFKHHKTQRQGANLQVSRRKLLLADDSITIQKVVNLTFADEGVDVVAVADGDAALAELSSSTPDILLADVNMPGPTGYEICERLRASEATQNLPVILLVGSFEPFDEAEASRVGANAYLTKPFQSIKQLITQVNELIEAASPPAVDPDSTEPLSIGEPAGEAPRVEDIPAAPAAVPTGAGLESETPLSPQPEADADSMPADDPAQAEPKYFDDLGYETGVPPTESPAEPFEKPDDIESLYAQSLSGDNEGLADVGLDDEIIETSYAAEGLRTAPDDRGTDDDKQAELPVADEPATSAEQPIAAGTDVSPSEPVQFTSGYEQRFPDDPSKFENTISYENWRPADMRVESEDTVADGERSSPESPQSLETTRLDESYPQEAEHAAPANVGQDTIRMQDRFNSTGSTSFQFDEVDLLDLANDSEQPVEITSPPHAVEQGSSKQLVTLSPELIEMIAQRVVEKLSEKY